MVKTPWWTRPTLLAFTIRVRNHRTEPQLIFECGGKRTDHGVLNAHITKRMTVDLTQPEVIAALIRVAPEVAKILR